MNEIEAYTPRMYMCISSGDVDTLLYGNTLAHVIHAIIIIIDDIITLATSTISKVNDNNN